MSSKTDLGATRAICRRWPRLVLREWIILHPPIPLASIASLLPFHKLIVRSHQLETARLFR